MNRYRVEIEIFEGRSGRLRKEGERIVYPESLEGEGICAWMYRGDGTHSYQVEQRFAYPEDSGKLCPWLLASVDGMCKTLLYGGTLPWRYKDTPYEKVIDPDGLTTEYVRCPDPTNSGIVVRLTRTVVGD